MHVICLSHNVVCVYECMRYMCVISVCACLSLLFECLCVYECVCVCANPLALLTEQKTLHRETRGIFGIGGSGRLRYRGSIGACV